ncbi:glycosyltransferase family 2 protein [Flavipsychrobacter stenotrophus]|uniref:Glycosyltransferase family 2 protein n=1 Tax=Flavipsychrobacter stenotrophus TaxID=2077091 RepID=A0A2S7T2H5_9BACT|nr:glycosyltransferase family 2 protein [Flavipsychrobacter stenotrophus]PQJ13081.1 glycosyltransferase family 2 protein [Flavipsychrobacter stenotrophus]
MTKKVSIVTVNFNHSHVTDAMLDSVFAKNTYDPLEIIVVDNGSAVDPIPAWQQKYPSVKYIRSEQNLGFAGGNNLGIQQATGDYLFFINNDTEITEGLIETLVATLEAHPECGIISPKIRYYDQPDMLQYAGFTPMNYYTARNNCIGQFEKDYGQYDNLTGETGYIHGAAMMLPRSAMDKAGLMPENYFLYYEEMDWCEMIKRAGYTIRINMQALIYHKESISVGSKSALKEYFMNRNRLLFIRRNCGFGVRAFFWFYFLGIVTPRNILSYIREKQPFAKVLLKAIWWNMTHSTNSKDLGWEIKK